MWGLPSRPVAWFIFTNDLSLSSPFKEAARCQVSTKSSHGTPSQPVLPSPRARAWPPGLPRARRPQPPAPPGFRLLALHLPAPQGPDVAVTLLYLPQRNPRPGRSRRRSPDRRAAGRRGPVPGTQEPRPQTPPRRPGQRWIRLRLRDLAQGQTRSRSLAWPRRLIRPDGVHEPLRGCEDGLLRTVARLSAAELGSRPPRQMSTRPELTRFSDRKLGRSCRRVRVEPGAAGWGLGTTPWSRAQLLASEKTGAASQAASPGTGGPRGGQTHLPAIGRSPAPQSTWAWPLQSAARPGELRVWHVLLALLPLWGAKGTPERMDSRRQAGEPRLRPHKCSPGDRRAPTPWWSRPGAPLGPAGVPGEADGTHHAGRRCRAGPRGEVINSGKQAE